MTKLLWQTRRAAARRAAFAAAQLMACLSIVGMLASCSSPPPQSPQAPVPSVATAPADGAPLPPALQQAKSRWVPVRWAELPGWEADRPAEAWAAWIKSCERPGPVFGPLCAEVRRLDAASPDAQRAWMMARLQPYRVEPLQGATEGLLTAYYEPVLDASRLPRAGFQVPLYRPPATLNSRRPWYTRQEIDTLPEAKAALRGREIAYLADPIDALVLHIQGSGRLRVQEADGSQRLVRVGFAATNDQPYKSVNQWLMDQGVTRLSPWPQATKDWARQNSGRVQQLLWSNPRFVFFREEALPEPDVALGPRGAQGVPLTAGRSIAVDPQSIPYGTPVWLASAGPSVNLQRLVLAQDTGSAIVGAVRADYYVGSGFEAGEVAGRLKQPLKLWVLWPKQP